MCCFQLAQKTAATPSLPAVLMGLVCPTFRHRFGSPILLFPEWQNIQNPERTKRVKVKHDGCQQQLPLPKSGAAFLKMAQVRFVEVLNVLSTVEFRSLQFGDVDPAATTSSKQNVNPA